MTAGLHRTRSAVPGRSRSTFRPGIDSVAQTLASSGAVDMLDGGAKANPKPSLANGVPTIYTSQVPAELIMFKGQPDFQPVVGTQLLWAANTTSDVLIDITNNYYYVLISGRWFDSAALTGPWTFVANNALPPDFAHIPPQSPAGAVLPTVAGTPQAQRGGDLQYDSADGDDTAHERPHLRAELRRSAAIFADRRHNPLVCHELLGAGDSGRTGRVLRGGRRASGSPPRRSRDRGSSPPRFRRRSIRYRLPRRSTTSRM